MRGGIAAVEMREDSMFGRGRVVGVGEVDCGCREGGLKMMMSLGMVSDNILTAVRCWGFSLSWGLIPYYS